MRSAPAGVAAEDLEHPRAGPDPVEGPGHVGVLAVAVDVHQEDVLPEHGLGGARLELGHVDLLVGELEQGADQGARPVLGEAEAEAGLVVAGGRRVVAGQGDEAGHVAEVIGDIAGEHGGPVQLGGAGGADRGGGALVGEGLGGGGAVGEGGDGGDAGEAALDELAALAEALGVGVEHPYVGEAYAMASDEALPDRDDHLAGDLQAGLVDQQVEGVVDAALQQVLDWQHADPGRGRLDRGDDGGDAGQGQQAHIRPAARPGEGGLFAERPGRAEVGDLFHKVFDRTFNHEGHEEREDARDALLLRIRLSRSPGSR